jgi:hypothetical protein
MGWFFLVMLILAVLTVLWKVYKYPETRTPKRIIEALILYLIFFVIGINSLWEFLGNVMYSDQVAEYMGWSTGSPFQIEVGMANLAFGILGVLCLWEQKDFWLATALGASIFLFGSGLVHLWQIIIRHNIAAGNAGAILYFELIFPIVLLVLMMTYRRLHV